MKSEWPYPDLPIYTTTLCGFEAFTDGHVICTGPPPFAVAGERKSNGKIDALIPRKLKPARRGKQLETATGLNCIDFHPHSRVQKCYVEFIQARYPEVRWFIGKRLSAKDRILIARNSTGIVAMIAPVENLD